MSIALPIAQRLSGDMRITDWRFLCVRPMLRREAKVRHGGCRHGYTPRRHLAERGGRIKWGWKFTNYRHVCGEPARKKMKAETRCVRNY